MKMLLVLGLFLGNDSIGGMHREDPGALRAGRRPVAARRPLLLSGTAAVSGFVYFRTFHSDLGGRVPISIRLSGQPSGPERVRVLAVRAEPAPARTRDVLGRGRVRAATAADGQTASVVRPETPSAPSTATELAASATATESAASATATANRLRIHG